MAHIPQTQIRPTQYMLSRTTILIVDDESGPRESLKMILSPAHKVLMADSGRSALDILRTTEVDLVTIDLQMPGMNGEELMRTVRAEHPAIEIIVITGNGSVKTAVQGLRSGICDYISKPFDVVEVSGAVSRALERKQQRSHLVEFLEGVGSVLGKDRDSGQLIDELESNDDLQATLRSALDPGADTADAEAQASSPEAPLAAGREARTQDPGEEPAASSADETLEFLDVLAQALESRDGELRKHSQRVGFYADLLAEQLGVPEELREQIRISSFLHDIGKVGLSDEDRERAQLRSRPNVAQEEEHPDMGARLVGPLGFDAPVAEAIRHHHEHWNGSGYPEGLEGETIPLAARVIAVVDTFDKLTSGMGEGAALTTEAALVHIQKQSGTRFDPAIVLAFVRMVENGTVEIGAEAPGPETHPVFGVAG